MMMKRKNKQREDWTYVNISKTLAEEIDKILETRQYPYMSRADFMAEAARKRIQEIQQGHYDGYHKPT
jgi:metal-responsive CopG/Arc/MetJ family transcriptional regulator